MSLIKKWRRVRGTAWKFGGRQSEGDRERGREEKSWAETVSSVDSPGASRGGRQPSSFANVVRRSRFTSLIIRPRNTATTAAVGLWETCARVCIGAALLSSARLRPVTTVVSRLVFADAWCVVAKLSACEGERALGIKKNARRGVSDAWSVA